MEQPEKPICPQCGFVCDSPTHSRKHKYRYHAVPLSLVLPDGTTNQVTKEDDGDYVCWCGASHKTRELSTSHVQGHFPGHGKIKVFGIKHGTCDSHRLHAHLADYMPVQPRLLSSHPLIHPRALRLQVHFSRQLTLRPPLELTFRSALAFPESTPGTLFRTRPVSCAVIFRDSYIEFFVSISAAAAAAPAPAEGAPGLVPAAPALGERPVLKPNTNYIVSHPVLDDIGVVMHIALRVLRCCRCLKYLTSGTIKGHMASHKFRISSDALAAAMEVCTAHRIHSLQKNVLTPRPMSTPVQDLPFLIGYACVIRDCDYAAAHFTTMAKHERAVHRLRTNGEGASGRATVTLQTLFNNPEVYFIVNPAILSCANPNIIQHLADDFIPAACQPPPILISSDDHGRSSLEKHFRFDSLLLAVRENRESLQHLGSLKAMAKPEQDGGIYVRLNGIVSSWFAVVPTMLDGNPVHYDLERVLFHGQDMTPRSRYVILSRSFAFYKY